MIFTGGAHSSCLLTGVHIERGDKDMMGRGGLDQLQPIKLTHERGEGGSRRGKGEEPI